MHALLWHTCEFWDLSLAVVWQAVTAGAASHRLVCWWYELFAWLIALFLAVVWQPGHHAVVERAVAQRGLCQLVSGLGQLWMGDAGWAATGGGQLAAVMPCWHVAHAELPLMAADARSRFLPCRCSLEYVGGTAGERKGSLCHAALLMARTLHSLPATCYNHSRGIHESARAPW